MDSKTEFLLKLADLMDEYKVDSFGYSVTEINGEYIKSHAFISLGYGSVNCYSENEKNVGVVVECGADDIREFCKQG